MWEPFFPFQDCEDPNPLIRALAVRTMGCIRVDKITEYLCEPLRKCLKDEDPYVRKTAAVCVAKLHDINAQMVEDQGFLDSLRDLIADSNPMVGLMTFQFILQQISSVGWVSFQSFIPTRQHLPLRLWPTQLLLCLKSASRTPTATSWTWTHRTSTSCSRPSTSAQSGGRSSSWTVCPTTTPRMTERPRGRPSISSSTLRSCCGLPERFSCSFSAPVFTPAASVSASLPGCLTPTQPWCCLPWKCWWSSWSCCPRTPTTTTPCWRSCPHHWSPYCQESLRSSMWLWGTSTSSSRKGVYPPADVVCFLPSDLTAFL